MVQTENHVRHQRLHAAENVTIYRSAMFIVALVEFPAEAAHIVPQEVVFVQMAKACAMESARRSNRILIIAGPAIARAITTTLARMVIAKEAAIPRTKFVGTIVSTSIQTRIIVGTVSWNARPTNGAMPANASVILRSSIAMTPA